MVQESKTNQRIGAQLLIHGRVQGVGFRFFAQDLARQSGLSGWVRNLPDGTVEALVEGSRQAIEDFIKKLEEGPSMGRVDDIRIQWQPAEGRASDFSITG